MRPRNPTVRFALFGRGTDAPTVHAQTKPAGHRVRSGSTFRRCAGPRHSPPHGFAGPAARNREKTGSLPPNDRIVPSTGMRPSTCTSSFRPSLRTGLDFGKASRHNIESFPYEPDGKSIRCPENRCAPPMPPPKTERGTDRPFVSRRTTFFVAASSPVQPSSGINIYRTAFAQAGTKSLRRRAKPTQEHALYPPTNGTPVSRNSVQRSRNIQLQRAKKIAEQKSLRIPTYRTSLSQTDIRILSQPFFSR